MTRQEDRKICAASREVGIQWNPAKYGDARVMRTPESFVCPDIFSPKLTRLIRTPVYRVFSLAWPTSM